MLLYLLLWRVQKLNEYYNDSKKYMILELERTLAHSEEKKAEYEQFDKLTVEKANLDVPDGCSLFLGGVILWFIVFMILISTNISSVLPAEPMIIVSTVVFVIILPIWSYGAVHANVNNKSAEIDKQLSELRTSLEQHFSAYKNPPVGFEYSHPAILIELIHIMKSGRADTIKEAINCLIEDIHRQEMLNVQKETAKNAEDAANAARATAMFSAVAFINTYKKK